MAKKKTPRNPQDATLRNTRAANKKLAELEKRIDTLERTMAEMRWGTDQRIGG